MMGFSQNNLTLDTFLKRSYRGTQRWNDLQFRQRSHHGCHFVGVIFGHPTFGRPLHLTGRDLTPAGISGES